MITLMMKYVSYLSNSKSETGVKIEMLLLWKLSGLQVLYSLTLEAELLS